MLCDVGLFVFILPGIRDGTKGLAEGAVEADLDVSGGYLRRVDSRGEETSRLDCVYVDELHDVSNSAATALTAAALALAFATGPGVVDHSQDHALELGALIGRASRGCRGRGRGADELLSSTMVGGCCNDGWAGWRGG